MPSMLVKKHIPPRQILENLENGMAEDGSMITLTQENKHGKHTFAVTNIIAFG